MSTTMAIYVPNDVIDGRYRVLGYWGEPGGMGLLLHVEEIGVAHPHPIILKYCHMADDRYLARFRREIRLLSEFKGNARVVDVVGFNVEHDPPYYVMRFYGDGDLSRIAGKLGTNYAWIETLFNQMIDCIAEVHARQTLHRDIKPQNFLRDGDTLVVTDFGLGVELEATTPLTKSSEFWGTHGFMPPECYLQGGFKHADVRSDIFMLGKTFYSLLTGREPTYLVPDGIPDPLFAVIDRCCSQNPGSRYGSLSELKQSLTGAFDILLERVQAPGKAAQLLSVILDRIEKDKRYDTGQIKAFVELLQMLEKEDRIQLCYEIKAPFFSALKQAPCAPLVGDFLEVYRQMAEDGAYGWSYAEVIADNMKTLFDSADVSVGDKVAALEIAMIAAIRQNRFAAMSTCQAMIISVTNDGLGIRVRDMIVQYWDNDFVENTEASRCKSPAVRAGLARVKELREARDKAAEAAKTREAGKTEYDDDIPF